MGDSDTDKMVAFVGPAAAGFRLGRSLRPEHRECTTGLPSRPSRWDRPVVVAMAKVKRGKGVKGNEAEENAVDVFGGAGLDQDSLLAAALAEPGRKSKKVGKKAAKSTQTPVVSSNGSDHTDVMPSNNEIQDIDNGSQEDIRGAIDNSEDSVRTKKSKKKGKTKMKELVLDDDSNVIEVFGGIDSDQESALPDATLHITSSPSEVDSLGEESPISSKRHGIAGSYEVNRSTPPLDESPTIAAPLIDASSNAEVFRDVNALASGEGESTNLLDSETGSSVIESPTESSDSSVEVEDKFVPDLEVVSEFDKFSENISDFTQAGRRKMARASRSERSREEGRLGDAKRANYGSGGEKFTSVRLEDVTVVFRSTTVLSGVTWGVKTGDRIGLVGQNGCGKTTQLKLMAGLLEPTSGEVVRSSSRTRFSFLRQEFVDELDPSRTLREEFLSAFHEERKALEEYEHVEQEIESAGENLERLEKLLNALETARATCDTLGAWNLDSRIDKVMPGLGFVEDDNDKLVASYSGGWKVRIGIGKVLLQDPDLLLLDEPSNHLDLQSVEWLEEYLQNCALPMVIVSHDREFINRVCNKIVDIEGGEAFEYPGNYSTFVKLKAEQRKAWEAAYERQTKFINEQQQYIKQNRFSAARSKQVKSREKMLQRMERTGQLVRRPPRAGKPLVFRFPPAPRSGQDVVLIDNLTHGYNDKMLFRGAGIAVERGDRMAIVGPNGCGKSTLLRLITEQEKPQSGTVRCKDLHNVRLAYFEQNQADALDLNLTVLDTLRGASSSEMTYEELRALLGKFLFKGDAVEKTVSALSGGEKARLALAKMMLEPANLMVLDEPTNHIDAAAMDMLEEALQHYDGTLIVVSHDRYFVSQVATQILFIEDQDIMLHDGDYKSFMEKDKSIKALAEARFVEGTDGIKSAPDIVIEETFEELEKKSKRKKKFGGSGVSSGRSKEMNAKRWKNK